MIDEHIPNGRRAQENLRGVPMKHYDLLREGIFVFVVVAIVAIVLAAVYGSPDYPTITAQSVANDQPVAFLKTTTGILLGNDLSAVADYGPPYTNDPSAAQHLGPIAPANWLGVTDPIDPAQDFVLGPLARVAKINWLYAAPLKEFKAAPAAQQQTWLTNYDKALDKATVSGGQVQVPPGDYGPVAPLMTAMLSLGQSGMLEGALAAEQNGSYYPYSFDFTRQLLYFANASPYMDTATRLVQQGNPQWGIVHETGRYPGAWWLAPYRDHDRVLRADRVPASDPAAQPPAARAQGVSPHLVGLVPGPRRQCAEAWGVRDVRRAPDVSAGAANGQAGRPVGTSRARPTDRESLPSRRRPCTCG